LSASFDKTIKFWNIESNECITTLLGHTKSVSCVKKVPDKKIIVSGSSHGEIKKWNLEAGVCIKTNFK